ncbi:DgyrCDS12234 [Dimorphilus gyrociliatus]|uniref:Mediator of RNA polymerase II transcription subunit 31 n=1 Tax=Dimorphilus gyrociliatus TaxID=2664684 RepID=A0A7I8W5V9_9ANNE|nr:DgyrCDS12234 [Dimorphilus gyrociliatus]
MAMPRSFYQDSVYGSAHPTNSDDIIRFQVELEFVQCLANPIYLNFLAQRGYLKDPSFINYLNYLKYWKKKEYAKFILYPQCLYFLELLQYESFRKELGNSQCAKFIEDQQLLQCDPVTTYLDLADRYYRSRMNSLRVLQSLRRVIKPQLFYSTQAGITERIDSMVKDKKLVVFMKGTPENPRCGFSNAVVRILEMHGVEKYDSYNVLEDEELRQGIKEYSDWPTIPQVYVNGDFLGGCDIMLDLHKNGDLTKELSDAGIDSTPPPPPE